MGVFYNNMELFFSRCEITYFIGKGRGKNGSRTDSGAD